MDASSLALGVALAGDEFIIEDACWLQLENDSRHINLAELDATLKGVNLALQWQARLQHSITDSVCVHRWITDALSSKAQLTTKASMVETIREYDLTVDVALVQSCRNRMDHLTRVPRWWLDLPKEGGETRTRLVDLHVSKKDVRSIVRACETCRSIDPAPVHWKKGKLSMKRN